MTTGFTVSLKAKFVIRNQLFDFHYKSNGWFLYGGSVDLESVKILYHEYTNKSLTFFSLFKILSF